MAQVVRVAWVGKSGLGSCRLLVVGGVGVLLSMLALELAVYRHPLDAAAQAAALAGDRGRQPAEALGV